ncbi:MAG TPA: hypothetical protein PK711_05980 [Bacteroidales bacterium]|nr:hypothetical protein [Bacteroidales bacterium]HRZ20619.1 hypothetical protein [Bacteroidales bacterium]
MKKVGIIILLALGLASCSTDVDLIGDYEDITVVYGLLNQNDSISYLKINKAFLGEGNALIMAQEPDSSSYLNNLSVIMEAWKNGILEQTFTFDTTTIYNKEVGTFYYPEQVLYRCVTSNKLDDESLYRLVITNELTGKIITASTPLVSDFPILKPIVNNPVKPTIHFPDNDNPKDLEWLSAKYGKLYNAIMRFHYKETFSSVTDTLYKYVETAYSPKKSETLEGGEEMLIQFANNSFYKLLEQNVPYEPAKEATVEARYAISVEYIFSVAGDDFNTFMEVNDPSSSIVQERPEYTNVENGIGIFSSRYNKSRLYYISPLTEEILLTKGLKFESEIGK